MRLAIVVLLALGSFLSGCDSDDAPPPLVTREPCAEHNPLRNAYYGDLHIHTGYSFDANSYDVETTPDDAYAFAKGSSLALPPLDATGKGTRTIRLDRPLDFAAVTDHSEFLGEVEACTVPGSSAYDSEICGVFRDGGDVSTRRFGLMLANPPDRSDQICGTNDEFCLQRAGEVWHRVISAANSAYDRSSACSFTSFIAYEYSANPAISNLHRNVIFRNETVPFPTTYFERPTPQGLWEELRATCLDPGNGCDVLAIPHNSNESNGNMFFVEYPGATSVAEERAQASSRAAIEPVVEIYQHKGDSECMNGLSGIVGEPDEQCNFEKRRTAPFDDCGEGRGMFGVSNAGCVSRLDYVRNVLLAGLQEEERLGVNPYRLGIIASTDTHNGAPGFVDEGTFVGHRGLDDDTPAKQLGPGVLTPGGIIFSPGGLAGVWAEENSRDSIFDALRRREVFGTSGPRLAVRAFGGWDLPSGLCSDPGMVQTAYQQGVPMGGVLPSRPAGATAPMFAVSALRDAGGRATLLQRLQMVKGWIENGERHYRVYDIAGEADNGATVDEATCQTSGPGFASLCAVWSDPDFDPSQRAYYYVRVLENPTCRWSTYTCNALPPAERPPSCSDPAVPRTVQERAWTSPIWWDGSEVG